MENEEIENDIWVERVCYKLRILKLNEKVDVGFFENEGVYWGFLVIIVGFIYNFCVFIWCKLVFKFSKYIFCLEKLMYYLWNLYLKF